MELLQERIRLDVRKSPSPEGGWALKQAPQGSGTPEAWGYDKKCFGQCFQT